MTGRFAHQDPGTSTPTASAQPVSVAGSVAPRLGTEHESRPTRSVHTTAPRGQPPWRLFIVLADADQADWLQASLATQPDFDAVHRAVGAAQAWSHPAPFSADVILLDCDLPDLAQFGQEFGRVASARLLLCTRRQWSAELADAMTSATGILSADALTAETVASAARAIRTGIAVLPVDHLRALCRNHAVSPDTGPAPSHTHLTPRERAVLTLVAQGIPSREIAHQLAYSERTIKNTLHDVLTKLDAKSRSHAVARAIRNGII